MKQRLSKDEKKLLEVLIRYRLENNQMPLRKEIGEILGISPQLVQYHLRKLEKKGHIKINPTKKRGITIT